MGSERRVFLPSEPEMRVIMPMGSDGDLLEMLLGHLIFSFSKNIKGE